MFRWLFLFVTLGVLSAQSSPRLQNPGFEAATLQSGQVPGWTVSSEARTNEAVVRVDEVQVKTGTRALLIDSKEPAGVSVSQELFLPVGSTWRVSVWIRGEALAGNREAS